MTKNEHADGDLLTRRREEFPQFLQERMPVLAEFAELLELPNPVGIVSDPASYVPGVEIFLRSQEISPEDRSWAIVRLGYLIGEVLIQRYGGCWLLNEVTGARYYARYVVGAFQKLRNRNAHVDPFDIADELLTEPPGRSLVAKIEEVSRELESA